MRVTNVACRMTLASVGVATLMLMGCSSGVTEEQKQAAVQRCIAKQASKMGSTEVRGNPTPEMRAQMEQAMANANAALQKMHQQMCERTVAEACKQSASACKRLVSEG
jgi:hypothetical protein